MLIVRIGTNPIRTHGRQLVQFGMALQAQHELPDGFRPGMGHKPCGSLSWNRCGNQLHVAATSPSLISSCGFNDPKIGMVQVEGFEGQGLAIGNVVCLPGEMCSLFRRYIDLFCVCSLGVPRPNDICF